MKKSMSMSIGKKVKTYRILNELSKAQLAKRVGTTAPTITRLEQGQKDLYASLLFRLANALNVDMYELLGVKHNIKKSKIFDYLDDEDYVKVVEFAEFLQCKKTTSK